MGKKKEVTIGMEENKSEKKEIQVSEGTKENKKNQKKAKSHHRGKKYLGVRVKIDKKKAYKLVDAIKLLKDLAYEKFDPSFELHANLLEKGIKGEVNLPHGTGKTVRIAVFDQDIEKKIQENKIDFDILLAQPKDMAKLVKFAKVLGPKGLMPSPKRGTLTDNIEEAKKKLSSGVIQYKSEPKFPIMHLTVGKKSFTEKQIGENVAALVKTIAKKNIQDLYLKTSMSPSVRIDVNSI